MALNHVKGAGLVKNELYTKSFTPKQLKAYTACLKSLKGLTVKEAEQVSYALTEGIKYKSIVG